MLICLVLYLGTIARLEAKVAEYEKKIGKPATS